MPEPQDMDLNQINWMLRVNVFEKLNQEERWFKRRIKKNTPMNQRMLFALWTILFLNKEG